MCIYIYIIDIDRYTWWWWWAAWTKNARADFFLSKSSPGSMYSYIYECDYRFGNRNRIWGTRGQLEWTNYCQCLSYMFRFVCQEMCHHLAQHCSYHKRRGRADILVISETEQKVCGTRLHINKTKRWENNCISRGLFVRKHLTAVKTHSH